MGGKRRRELKIKWYSFIKKEGFRIVFYFLIFAVLVVLLLIEKIRASIFNASMFFSFVAAAVLVGFSDVFSRLFFNRIEDGLKLTEDYEKILKIYCRTKIICADNSKATEENKQAFMRKHKIKKGEPQVFVRLPEIWEGECFIKPDTKLVFHDSKKMYEFPKYIESHYNELFAAHQTSVNQDNLLLLRGKDWSINDKECNFWFERTTNFNSLVTNRAIDFRLGSGVSVRARYESGPFLTPLKESSLSNNIGGNGYIMTCDGWIPIRINNAWTIIAKNTIGPSFSYSAKAEELVDDNGDFDPSLVETHLKKATIHWLFKKHGKEPPKETRKKYPEGDPRTIPAYVDNHVTDVRIIACVRDLVEGGKPNTVSFAHTDLSRKELEKEMGQNNKYHDDRHQRLKGCLWVYAGTDSSIMEKYDSPDDMYIDENEIVLNGRCHKVTPWNAVCLELMRRYLRESGSGLSQVEKK